MGLLSGPISAYSSTTIIYIALLSTVCLALFPLPTNTVSKEAEVFGNILQVPGCGGCSIDIRRTNEQWDVMVSAAKAADASTNWNDVPVEGDNATDVSTGNTDAQGWVYSPAEQLVPHHHHSGHGTGNLSMFPPQDDFKQNFISLFSPFL